MSKTPIASAQTYSFIAANPERYFVLRSGASPGKAYHLSNMVESADKKSLTCTLDTLPAEHQLHLSNGRGGKMRYKRHQPEKAVLSEIHLYILNDDSIVAGNNYTLVLDKIQKIEVLKKKLWQNNCQLGLGQHWNFFGCHYSCIGYFYCIKSNVV